MRDLSSLVVAKVAKEPSKLLLFSCTLASNAWNLAWDISELRSFWFSCSSWRAANMVFSALSYVFSLI